MFFLKCSFTLCYFIEVLGFTLLLFIQSIMSWNILHHKLEWTSHFQIVNMHLLMMIYWTSKKVNNIHPQELVRGHMKGS